MKLKTEKLLFTKESKLAFFFIFFSVFFLSPFTGQSQHFLFKFDNTPVSEALTEVADSLNIKIAFDADKLGKLTISKEIRSGDNDQIISSILEHSGYTFQFKHETYLIVKRTSGTEKPDNKILVSGIIFDKESRERLPYATILLQNGKSLATTVDGTFSSYLPDAGTFPVQINYMGYYTFDTTLTITNDIAFIPFGLTRKTQTIQTIEVKGEKLKMVDFSSEAGHLIFNPSRFSDLPNYGETDIFRALQMLPGISSMENSSQLNIRGSTADQNLVMFDGFTLYNLDHFFGVFSALNPYVIKNIQVYRGGFDSRYGERISGIVDITGKSGNRQKPQFYGGINLISGNLTAEIPITERLTVIAAGRRAYSDVYSSWLADALLTDKIGQNRRFPGADNVIEPRFYFADYNFKLTYNINQKENISVSAYGAKDYLNSSNLSQTERTEINTKDINEWGNSGFGGSWKKQWKPNYFTNVQIGHSGYYNDYFNNTILSGGSDFRVNNSTNEENDLTDYFLSIRNKFFLNSQNQFEFGVSAKYYQFEFYKDASPDFIYNILNRSAFLYTFYFQDKITSKKNFMIKPGLRLSFYSPSRKVYFEPRLTASYKAKDGIVFKMAVGRYFQYLNKSLSEQTYGYNRDFWVLANDELHPVVSSNHFIIGANVETQNLFFDLEAYYKTVDGLQEYLFFQDPERRFGTEPPPDNPELQLSQFISGKGKAYGIDFLAKYEHTNLTSWLAYSISRATRNFPEINSGDNIPASYDQTHELKWTNIYSYKKWNFSTLTLFTTGHPYIEHSTKDDDFNTSRTYNRLPNYFRIDFSANYNFNVKGINIKPGFSILNALNTENYLDVYTRIFNFQDQQLNETTLIKAQDLTLNFFVNFRF